MESDIRQEARGLLRESAEWLTTYGWTTECLFRDWDGNPMELMACPDTGKTIPRPGNGKPFSACMSGAIHVCARNGEAAVEAEELLGDYLRQVGLECERSFWRGRIATYNDNHAHSVQEVVGAMVIASWHGLEVS